jgi:hypothetical protein
VRAVFRPGNRRDDELGRRHGNFDIIKYRVGSTPRSKHPCMSRVMGTLVLSPCHDWRCRVYARFFHLARTLHEVACIRERACLRHRPAKGPRKKVPTEDEVYEVAERTAKKVKAIWEKRGRTSDSESSGEEGSEIEPALGACYDVPARAPKKQVVDGPRLGKGECAVIVDGFKV